MRPRPVRIAAAEIILEIIGPAAEMPLRHLQTVVGDIRDQFATPFVGSLASAHARTAARAAQGERDGPTKRVAQALLRSESAQP